MTRPVRFPGEELVRDGVSDLRAGGRSVPALLVASARHRLAALGVEVPAFDGDRPNHDLYDLLAEEDPAAAHGKYNALMRRLVSYVRAADHARPR